MGDHPSRERPRCRTPCLNFLHPIARAEKITMARKLTLAAVALCVLVSGVAGESRRLRRPKLIEIICRKLRDVPLAQGGAWEGMAQMWWRRLGMWDVDDAELIRGARADQGGASNPQR